MMRSPCAGAALDPPIWIVPNNKALALSLRLFRTVTFKLPVPFSLGVYYGVRVFSIA